MSVTAPICPVSRGLISLLVLGAGVAFGPAAAMADATPVGIDDVTFDLGFSKYTAKHLELTGSDLSPEAFKDLLASLAKGVSADSLAKLNATSIVIPELDLDETLAGTHQTAHYRDVKLTGIHDGKIGTYSISGGTMSGSLPDGQATNGIMRQLGGTDIDLPGLVRVFSETSTGASAPLKPLYGTAYGDGFDIKTPMFDMSIGKTAMSGIRGRPLTKSLSEIMTQLPKPPAPGQTQTPEEQKAALEFMSSIFDVYGAFAFDTFEVHDLKMTSHGDPAHQMPEFSVTVSQMAMTGYADSRVGEMSIEGFDVAPPQGKFHLGKIALKGFDFREALTGMSQFMRKAAALPAGAPPSADDLKSLKMAKLDDLSISDVEADFSVPSPTEPDAPAQYVQFSLASYDLKPELWADGLPKSVLSKLDHLIFDLPPNTLDAELMTAAGFAKLDVSSTFQAEWDETAQRFTVKTAQVEAKDLGSATISLSADNVPPEAFSADQFARQAAWLGGLQKSADIRFENQKLFDLMIAMEAKQTGKPEDKARSDMITGAAIFLPTILGDSPAAKTLIQSITKYIANPRSLHIAATSKDGIGPADLAPPNFPLDKVDLTANANN